MEPSSGKTSEGCDIQSDFLRKAAKKASRNPAALTGLIVLLAGLITVTIMALTTPPEFADDTQVTVRIDQGKVRAQVAVSSAKLAKGLMGAKALDDEQGMLFVYEDAKTPSIWMKDVGFPIDIVWISGDTVTQVTPNVPPGQPDVADADLPRYRPAGPVDKVLEVRSGWAQEHSVQPGDPVRFSR